MSISVPESNSASISAIIPAYNAAAYVHRAIESILAQTRPVKEILVIDDGSSDNTFETVRGFPPPVRGIRKPNGGPASARNLGARAATGEWLGFLDADDAWHPDKLQKQMAFASPVISAIHCLLKGSPRTSDFVCFDELWQRNPIATSTVLIRRSVFMELGGFDEDRSLIGVEDYNLWLRLAAVGKQIATVQEILVDYTPATGSLTRQAERFADAELLNLRKIETILDIPPERAAQKRLQILDQYGLELLHYRELQSARRLLSEALRQQFSLLRFFRWGASLLPRPIYSAYDYKRRVHVNS